MFPSEHLGKVCSVPCVPCEGIRMRTKVCPRVGGGAHGRGKARARQWRQLLIRESLGDEILAVL